jgi:type IV pilus assembly protein PilF
VLASACVTTTETVFTEKASPEKALERRVELARNYVGQRDWENAKRNLKLAYEIDPNNAEVHEAFALVYQSTGEFELAEDSYKTAIRLDKGFSRARNNYAAFLYSQERYEEAEKQLEYVVKDTLYEGRPRAFVNLGLCRQQLFDSQGAEEAFLRALTMDRTNRIALLEVAEIRFDAGDLDNAGRYYDTYRSVARTQSARGLWLGIRIARATGDRDAEGSYALALSNMYPESAEYQSYKRSDDSD